MPGTWGAVRPLRCSGLIKIVWLCVLLSNIRGLGRIFVVWSPYLGWFISIIGTTGFFPVWKQGDLLMPFPIIVISIVVALWCWQYKRAGRWFGAPHSFLYDPVSSFVRAFRKQHAALSFFPFYWWGNWGLQPLLYLQPQSLSVRAVGSPLALTMISRA